MYFNGSVAEIHDETRDIRRVLLSTAKPLEFGPGQYATLQFTPDHIRPYSMAGLQEDAYLEFHVRLVPGGRVSPYVFDTLRVGDTVRVSGPLGASYLRRRHDGPMLIVAGGTGLAPGLSILRGARAAGMRNPIHFYFGVRSARDIYALDRLAGIAASHPQLTVHAVVAQGEAPRGMRGGLLTETIEADWAGLDGFRAYLWGAPAMVEAVTIQMKRLGVPAARIHADAFYSTAY